MQVTILEVRAPVLTVNEAIAFAGADPEQFILHPDAYHEPRLVKHGDLWIDVQRVEKAPLLDWDARTGSFLIRYLTGADSGFVRLGLILSH